MAYFIAVIKDTDITGGAKWGIKEEEINFSYLEADTMATQTFTIENTGLFEVQYEIDGQNGYTISPESGLIRAGSVKTITVELNVSTQVVNTPHVIVRSVGTNTASCFSTLSIPASSRVTGII